eukprot:2847436-Amphidinium_carterae.1
MLTLTSPKVTTPIFTSLRGQLDVVCVQSCAICLLQEVTTGSLFDGEEPYVVQMTVTCAWASRMKLGSKDVVSRFISHTSLSWQVAQEPGCLRGFKQPCLKESLPNSHWHKRAHVWSVLEQSRRSEARVSFL